VDDLDRPYSLVLEPRPDLHDLGRLEEEVAAAAIAAAGAGEDEEFGLFVRDAGGTMLAGISGSTWGGCCQLQAMWVDPSLRGRGLARSLLAAAEEEARRRGCGMVMFLAYDLIAPAFYERFGYETVAVLDGCPAGSATRWYRKSL
jgi:GNAT superfamily N-acetyltransferase